MGTTLRNLFWSLNCCWNKEECGFHFPTPHERLACSEDTNISQEFLGWIQLVVHCIWIGRCWVLVLFWSNRGDKLTKAASEPWNEMRYLQCLPNSCTEALLEAQGAFLTSPLCSFTFTGHFKLLLFQKNFRQNGSSKETRNKPSWWK